MTLIIGYPDGPRNSSDSVSPRLALSLKARGAAENSPPNQPITLSPEPRSSRTDRNRQKIRERADTLRQRRSPFCLTLSMGI